MGHIHAFANPDSDHLALGSSRLSRFPSPSASGQDLSQRPHYFRIFLVAKKSQGQEY